MASSLGGNLQDTIDQLKLVDLPTDVLLCIFKFCDSASLRNLCICCKRLECLISEDCVWSKQSKLCIVTNQLSNDVLQRSFIKIKAKEKCRISRNWINGCYKEKIYSNDARYMPWLHLEARVLWISRGKTIWAVERQRDGLKMQTPMTIVQLAHSEDISRFVKTDDFIFTGGKDKMICGWSTVQEAVVLCQRDAHDQDILGLDCRRSTLVSCSKDNTIKVWQTGADASSLQCAQTLSVYDRVWCVATDPSLSFVAAGSAGYFGVYPLHIYDLVRGVEIPLTPSVTKKGAAVFDIKWECPNTLITCGFDTILRLWDLRVGVCVGVWTDPFGAPGYCLASDQSHSVFCGTAHHGRVQLWDKRASTSVQAYFGRSGASSPVYGLSFDPGQLFIAQDSCVNVLDFTHLQPHSCRRADYSSYWAARQS